MLTTCESETPGKFSNGIMYPKCDCLFQGSKIIIFIGTKMPFLLQSIIQFFNSDSIEAILQNWSEKYVSFRLPYVVCLLSPDHFLIFRLLPCYFSMLNNLRFKSKII